MTNYDRQSLAAMTVPEELAGYVAARTKIWAEARGAVVPDKLPDTMSGVFACSDFVAAHCIRNPTFPDDLDREVSIAESFASRLADPPDDEQEFMAVLRRLRNDHMARIAWQDLAGRASLDETLSNLTELAEICIRTGLSWAQTALEKTHGVLTDSQGQAQSLVVIAMGKLGGSELNFSSDVDLILLYPEAGESDGPRTLNSEQYFSRIGQTLIRVLDQPTEDGFVFRVDTRLRPFGTTGALALSFAAFELYLQQHGREWERYAYIKARPLTGTDTDKLQFLEMVRPFVYRRYLDYGVLESLREMKSLIAADVSRRDRVNDIKLGPGGIREIEFIAQTFQLLRGGADPALRIPALRVVLQRLAASRWLDKAATDDLYTAYQFLRRVENRLQEWRDEQTHHLPDDTNGRARIAYAMGFPNWPEFFAEIQRIRTLVTHYFEAAVPGPAGEGQVDVLRAAWKADPGSGAATRQLALLGFEPDDGVQKQLQVLHASGQYRSLDRRGRQRLDSLIPQMLRLAVKKVNAVEVVSHLLNIIVAVGRRSAYFALLNENPVVMERLTDLCAISPWLARRVAQHPILLDELIDPRIFEVPATRDQFSDDMTQRFVGVADDDLERAMEALRMFQQASVFRVAVSDLSGVLPLMKVSDRLTDIAELVLDKTINLASKDLRRQFGAPQCIDDNGLREAGFAVIGYGKLGGLELGYASDLDLVLLHDSTGRAQKSNGEKSLDNTRYFSRLGQRMLHMLSTTTASGVLYEVDTRLRPSGKGGPLVSSLSGFENYQREAAWTWEHQALLRARAVAGDVAVCVAFEATRRAILTAPRDTTALSADVLSMRQRMRRELTVGGADYFDIKQDTGGLTDIEFMVQYWLLANAAQEPALIEWSDNIRQLESLAAANVVTTAVAQELTDIYRNYRQRVHRLALADQPPRVPVAEFVTERDLIRARWDNLFGK